MIAQKTHELLWIITIRDVRRQRNERNTPIQLGKQDSRQENEGHRRNTALL